MMQSFWGKVKKVFLFLLLRCFAKSFFQSNLNLLYISFLVLFQYKDQYYFEVLGGLAVTYLFLQTFAIPGSIFLSIVLGKQKKNLYVRMYTLDLLKCLSSNIELMMHHFISGYLFSFPVALAVICICSATGASFCYLLRYRTNSILIREKTIIIR